MLSKQLFLSKHSKLILIETFQNYGQFPGAPQYGQYQQMPYQQQQQQPPMYQQQQQPQQPPANNNNNPFQ